MLSAHTGGLDDSGPVRDIRHPYAAFGQVHLAADQRPVVRETLTAVVAGEDDQRVVELTVFLQRVDEPANAFVHVVDHALVGGDVAAVQMGDFFVQRFGYAGIVPRLPGPMRRGVVQAQKKRRVLPGHSISDVDRAARDQIGQVTGFVFFIGAVVQVVYAVGGAVGEVVHPTGHGAKELVVARLERPEMRRESKVPFANQGGTVTACFK